ncbi:hypothetical protein M0805_008229 [Coniferiporia weirii]|nr:hypothetical protein M0805_008229 [Coniferiporia weirii]
MPVTRSATRLTRQSSNAANARPLDKDVKAEAEPSAKSAKKKATKSSSSTEKPVKAKKSQAKDKSAKAKDTGNSKIPEASLPHASVPLISFSEGVETAPALLPAVLSFSFSGAKQHLINADPRFEDLFSKMPCRPFEHLETVDPFRTLATSILGQQISWLAARAVTHKFVRLFDPSLPEKPSESGQSAFFPSARQVALADIATLRTAGLSGRKAEYVRDLAARFADGRLSNEKILEADDELLYEMLIAVYGIGRWTVDMFAIFSLRRPDILPVGDLGVQRGIARWVLSLHSPEHPYSISPRKLPKALLDDEDTGGPQTQAGDTAEDALPVRALTPDASSFLPAPVTPVRGHKAGATVTGPGSSEGPAPPQAFTPSINRTLNKVLPASYIPPPLPEGLGIKDLQSRVNGKKVKKGVILTPKEMEELTESWRPYRSLGVYYMWALAEGSKS